MADGDLEDVFLTHVDPNKKETGGVPWSAAPKGNPRLEQKRKASKRLGPNASLAMMMLLPWVFFCTALLMFSLRYHHHPWEVWGGATLLAFVGILTMVSDAGQDSGGWFLYLGTLLITGLAAGSITGLYNYQANTFRYWAYDEYRQYTNVLPSQLAKAHLDAGSIRFAEEARVDTTRTVGFKANSVFCVAPIIDDSGPGTPIEYWAAGRDCCSKRSKFTCDDVWSAFAKSGVVMRDAGGFVPSDRNFYMKAVREASAAYDLVSAPEPLFVSWVVDPGSKQGAFWEEAEHTMLVASIVYLVVSLVFGGILTYSTKLRRKNKI